MTHTDIDSTVGRAILVSQMAENTGKSEAESKRAEYPYATLGKSLEIAKAISDLGGSNENISRSLLRIGSK